LRLVTVVLVEHPENWVTGKNILILKWIRKT
jgi:hypothetical protein